MYEASTRKLLQIIISVSILLYMAYLLYRLCGVFLQAASICQRWEDAPNPVLCTNCEGIG